MKEILFATGNASKVARFNEKLLEKGILLKSNFSSFLRVLFVVSSNINFYSSTLYILR